MAWGPGRSRRFDAVLRGLDIGDDLVAELADADAAPHHERRQGRGEDGAAADHEGTLPFLPQSTQRARRLEHEQKSLGPRVRGEERRF